MSDRGLMELSKRGLIPVLKKEGKDLGEPFMDGKQHRVKFAIDTKLIEGQLELVHSDVWGPAPVAARNGAKYFVTFIDDCSRKVWVYLLREKSEVLARFKSWRAEVEKETGRTVRSLRSDNGGEWTSKEFRNHCEKSGIRCHYTVKKTSQETGVAERMNRVLAEKTRSLRLHASLPKEFWGDALTFSSFLVNRSPNYKLEGGIPEEHWNGKKVELGHLKVFGCPAYAHVEAANRRKLDPKPRKMVFIGYPEGMKGFLLWDPQSQQSTISQDVIFDERSIVMRPGDAIEAKEANLDSKGQDSQDDGMPSTSTSKRSLLEVELGRHVPTQVEDQRGVSSVQVEVQMEPQSSDMEVGDRGVALHKPQRNIRRPVRYDIDETISYALISAKGDPEMSEDAMESPDRVSWGEAMMEETVSLEKKKAWRLLDLRKDARVIASKRRFTRKKTPLEQGGVHYKARLVDMGALRLKGLIMVMSGSFSSCVARMDCVARMGLMDIGDKAKVLKYQGGECWHRCGPSNPLDAEGRAQEVAGEDMDQKKHQRTGKST